MNAIPSSRPIFRRKPKDPLYLFKKAMENRQMAPGWKKSEEVVLISFWHANKAILMRKKKETPRGNGALEEIKK